MGIGEPQKDLETELWAVYSRLESLDDEKDKATLELKALELIAKIRSQGEKVKPNDAATSDSSLAKARATANGVRK